MPTCRVTEKKVKEHLGSQVDSILDPFQSREYRYILLLFAGWFFVPLVLSSVVQLKFKEFPSPVFWGLFLSVWGSYFLLVLIFYLGTRRGAYWICAERITDLVNDESLLFLNSKEEDYLIKGGGKKKKGKLSEAAIKYLAYLKKYKSTQGMYKAISSVNDSNSTSKMLRRLLERRTFGEPIVKLGESDYQYVPLKFKVVDENNVSLNTERARKMGFILEKAWDLMLKEQVEMLERRKEKI